LLVQWLVIGYWLLVIGYWLLVIGYYSAVSDWRLALWNSRLADSTGLAISKGLLFRLPFKANSRHIKPWPRFLELCG